MECRQGLKCFGFLFRTNEIWHGGICWAPLCAIDLRYCNEAREFREGQWPEKNGVEQTEYGDVRTNADGQGKDANGIAQRCLAKDPGCIL